MTFLRNIQENKEPFLQMRESSTDENDGVKTTTTVEFFEARLVPVEIQLSLSFLIRVQNFFLSITQFSEQASFIPQSKVISEFYNTLEIWN